MTVGAAWTLNNACSVISSASCGCAKDSETLLSPRRPGALRDLPDLQGCERVNEPNEEVFSFNKVAFTLQQETTQEISSVNVSSFSSPAPPLCEGNI